MTQGAWLRLDSFHARARAGRFPPLRPLSTPRAEADLDVVLVDVEDERAERADVVDKGRRADGLVDRVDAGRDEKVVGVEMVVAVDLVGQVPVELGVGLVRSGAG